MLGRSSFTSFPSPEENSCNWHFWHSPGAVLAAQENGWEASRRCQSLLGFSFLFLKVGIKAKGFRQYKCQSSCFSLLYFFNEMVYSSQMICNQFIGFNYCVKKKKKNKPCKLGSRLCIQSEFNFSGYFQGLWSLVWVHGMLYHSQDRDRTWPRKKFTKHKKNNNLSRKRLFLSDLIPLQCLLLQQERWFCFLKYAGHTASS